MSTNPPTAYHLTRLLGLTTSAFLSAFAFSASYYTLPALALAPLPLRLQQWLVVYDLGKLVSPPLTALGAGLWGYASYAAYQTTSSSRTGGVPGAVKVNTAARLNTVAADEWKFYLAAAVLTGLVLPWTVGVMLPTNKALMRAAKVGREGGAEVVQAVRWVGESEGLLGRWGWMNSVRAVLPIVGAVVGGWGALAL